MSEPPRLDRKIIGFRTWAFKPASDGHAARLYSNGLNWSPGQNTAKCEVDRYAAATSHVKHKDPAPHPDCSCGLYAWHELPYSGGDAVLGAVAAWGRVEVHPDGFRAQYAEPVVLAYHESQSWRLVEQVRQIATDWGIPYVEWSELEAAASEFGALVPLDLRPEGAEAVRGIKLGSTAFNVTANVITTNTGTRISTGGSVIDIGPRGQIRVHGANVDVLSNCKIGVLTDCYVDHADHDVFEKQVACSIHEETACAYPSDDKWRDAYDRGYELGKQAGAHKPERRRWWRRSHG